MNSLPEGYETQINSSTTRRSRPTDGRSISCEFGWCRTEPGACGSSTSAPASETLDPAPAGTASYSGWKPPTQAPERPDRSGRSCKGRRHPSAPRSFPPGRLIDRRILPAWPRSAPRRSRMRLLSAGSMSACGRSPMACRCVRLAGRCPTSTWMGCGRRNGRRAGSAAWAATATKIPSWSPRRPAGWWGSRWRGRRRTPRVPHLGNHDAKHLAGALDALPAAIAGPTQQGLTDIAASLRPACLSDR
jgi:hypothetical protein